VRRIAIYNPYLETMGGGEKVCLGLAEVLSKIKGNEVHLITHDKVNLNALEKYFDLDLSKVKVYVVRFDTLIMKILSHLPLPGTINNFIHDIKVLWSIKKRGFDMFVNNCYQSNLPGPCAMNVYMCMFPQELRPKMRDIGYLKAVFRNTMRLIYRVLLHPKYRHAVFSYDLITANSEYTKRYIKKYWGLDSQVLYPLCDNMADASQKKRKIILNVGRFFENSGDNHHKKQDLLIDSFIKMAKLQKDGWELHFAGTVAEDVGALKYILKLMRVASGYPIYFHFNCSFSELKKLYNDATIYWHATGFGSDPLKYPEKQEHFGISTVEAMSAGCIPIVINSAGQRETVIEGESGFLWDTKKELIDKTLLVAQDNPEYVKIKQKAMITASEYFKKKFDYRCIDLFLLFNKD
jgi:glycosyltransferase involved in cell wall biosynthesis